MHREIGKEIQKSYPDFIVRSLDDFDREEKTLPIQNRFPLLGQESTLHYTPKQTNFTYQGEKNRSSFNPNAPLKKTLVIIGDSYFESEFTYTPFPNALYYYADSFENVHFFRTHETPNIVEILNSISPDYVIYEAADRILPQQYYKGTDSVKE